MLCVAGNGEDKNPKIIFNQELLTMREILLFVTV